MKTYHKDLGLPKAVGAFCGKTFCLLYTRHAYSAALNDRYGQVDQLPKTLDFGLHQVIEVEMADDSRVHKLVIRKPYDDRRDLVLVCLNDEDGLLRVKTVWTNLKTDNHRTLRTENYARI